MNPNGFGYPTSIPADELAVAVANNFLTKEEARTIYWSQFEVLKTRALSTPPMIEQPS